MASPSNLIGARILVTGAGRGIGRAMAHIFHHEGARVALCARTLSDLQETVSLQTSYVPPSSLNTSSQSPSDITSSPELASSEESHDSRFLLLPCDVTDEAQVESMVEAIIKQWGGLDILVNNAGGGQSSKSEVSMLSSPEFRHLLDLNVVAVHTVTSSVLRHSSFLRSIVNVSSRAGKMGLSGNAFYCASKFALEGYSATLAEELAQRTPRIVVNTLSPGMVNTESFPKQPGIPGVRTAESVRDGLLLLAQQDQVTGHYLHVDELDHVRAKGLPDTLALRPINEKPFSP